MDSVERVKNMVRHSLIAKPDVTNRELLARAKEIAPQAVEGLSLRQFHARFRLPIMRHEMGSRRRDANGAKGKRAGGAARAKSGARTGASARSANGGTRKRGASDGPPADVRLHGAVREILIEFAVQLEEAESRSALVRAVSGVDTFVERIVALRNEQAARPKSGGDA